MTHLLYDSARNLLNGIEVVVLLNFKVMHIQMQLNSTKFCTKEDAFLSYERCGWI